MTYLSLPALVDVLGPKVCSSRKSPTSESLSARRVRPRTFLLNIRAHHAAVVPFQRHGSIDTAPQTSKPHKTGDTQGADPHVGIFWVVQTADSGAKLLAAGRPLGQAEPYGDCLTYGPGHHETWAQWRCDRTVDPALRALVRTYEYEDWPRGRIVFDRARDLFLLYADRKLMTPAMIARIETQFHLPEGRTEIQSDWHNQNALSTRSTQS
jgi:hypothetical protein